MRISFNPFDIKDTRSVLEQLKKIGTIAPTTSVPLIDINAVDVNTVPETNVTAIPGTEAPAAAPATGEVDARGMPHDPAVHNKGRTKDAKGFWKATRGKADECAAAIAAFESSNAPVAAPVMPAPVMPAPVMPAPVMPAPVMPAVNVPVPPPIISHADLVGMFVGMMEDGIITDAGEVYAAAGVNDPMELQTNETLRAKLHTYLASIPAA